MGVGGSGVAVGAGAVTTSGGAVVGDTLLASTVGAGVGVPRGESAAG